MVVICAAVMPFIHLSYSLCFEMKGVNSYPVLFAACGFVIARKLLERQTSLNVDYKSCFALFILVSVDKLRAIPMFCVKKPV